MEPAAIGEGLMVKEGEAETIAVPEYSLSNVLPRSCPCSAAASAVLQEAAQGLSNTPTSIAMGPICAESELCPAGHP